MIRYRVGVDVGGTFTDIVLLGSDGSIHTKKSSSSVENYAQAIVAGLAEVFSESRIGGDAIEEIRHGTTVGSNAILEHKGARTGLITTQGFRDVRVALWLDSASYPGAIYRNVWLGSRPRPASLGTALQN